MSHWTIIHVNSTNNSVSKGLSIFNLLSNNPLNLGTSKYFLLSYLLDIHPSSVKVLTLPDILLSQVDIVFSLDHRLCMMTFNKNNQEIFLTIWLTTFPWTESISYKCIFLFPTDHQNYCRRKQKEFLWTIECTTRILLSTYTEINLSLKIKLIKNTTYKINTLQCSVILNHITFN